MACCMLLLIGYSKNIIHAFNSGAFLDMDELVLHKLCLPPQDTPLLLCTGGVTMIDFWIAWN